MDIKRISPFPDHCTVTLDIPWDIAEALVSSGPSLIANLREAVKQHKQTVDDDAKLNEYRKQSSDSPLQEWQALASEADQYIRVTMADEGSTFSKAISKAAVKYHFPTSSMHALISAYRAKQKEENKKSLNTEAIRLYFKGYSDREIGKRLNTSSRNIQRIITGHKDIIQFARNQIIAEKPKATKETRAQRNARFLLRNAEIVEQHNNGVGKTSLANAFKLSIPTIQKILKTCKVTSSELDREKVYQARKEHHKKIGVQLYRHYRRMRPLSSNAKAVYIELGQQFAKQFGDGCEIPTFYVEQLIQSRRYKVTAYINIRRLSTILRLKTEKYSNSDIAPILGLHEKTIARIIRHHKASLAQGGEA